LSTNIIKISCLPDIYDGLYKEVLLVWSAKLGTGTVQGLADPV